MEKLKSVVPETLKTPITHSTADDLPSTCSSLLQFFLHLPQFHQVVRDLTDLETALCRKNKDDAMESKRKGNECFSNGDYSQSLSFYSKALRVAPIDAEDKDKNLVATLYVNRASVLHRMGLLAESLRDCNRALEISPSYAKAWYRRGKANTSLQTYEEAVRDLNVAMRMETSLSGKRQIESELKLILDQCNGTNGSVYESNANNLSFLDEPHQTRMQCVSTQTKGRGMASLSDIPQSSLIHVEEPYAAIILKKCRETHCHFCFSELPADSVPCWSCTIPLYCSQQCQVQAGGKKLWNNPKNHSVHEILSDDLERYIMDVTLTCVSDLKIECFAEHRHECHGVHWPAILPSEIVLAGRILAKSIEQRGRSRDVSNLTGNLELSHNYDQLLPESKLELHIYSILLLYCLQNSYAAEFPINGVTVSQVIKLLSRIKVNSMAVVRLKFSDACEPPRQYGTFSSADHALTSNLEQVKVGQAIYSTGSLFNHSCQPNIHAYFLSRKLYIRSTESVAANSALELSYGPQVGELDHKDRQQYLEDRYSFKCQCTGCSELNLSDLVLNALRCVKPNCFGVVLDSYGSIYVRQRINHFLGVPPICGPRPHMQVEKLKNDGLEVARCVSERAGRTHDIEPGYCLKCGSYRDLESSHATVSKAEIYIRRFQDAIVFSEVSTNTLSDALRSLDLLKSTLHAYNKKIAEVEDNVALVFCLVGELQPAMDHCKASIQILEKLYDPGHIVIGNELVKLTSIQLALGVSTAVDSINRLGAIYSRYYGSHADKVFPYLQRLKAEASKLV